MEPPTEFNDAEKRATIDADILSGLYRVPRKTVTLLTLLLWPLEIPLFQRPLSINSHGSSAWARSYRIDIKDDEGEDESYFMKVIFPLIKSGGESAGT